MLADSDIKDFLARVGEKSAVPGGGTVAALGAALAAALSEMVGNLTIGKKGYESLEQEMASLVEKASAFRDKLLKDMDRDAGAYAQVMSAFRMPKDTEEEKNARTQAIQEGLKMAASVPLEVAGNALDIMELAEEAAKKGNKNTVCDALVAVLTARSAGLSALYNVRTNLGSIKDRDFAEDMARQVERLEKEIRKRETEILSDVRV